MAEELVGVLEDDAQEMAAAFEEGGGGSSYALPIATPDTLGGVKPAAKTEAMTQSVGVDENGGLWTGKTPMELIADITLTEDVNMLQITKDTGGNAFALKEFYLLAMITPPVEEMTKRGSPMIKTDGVVDNFPHYLYISCPGATASNGYPIYTVVHMHQELGKLVFARSYGSTLNNAASYRMAMYRAGELDGINEWAFDPDSFLPRDFGINGLCTYIRISNGTLTAGSRFAVWGVRA